MVTFDPSKCIDCGICLRFRGGYCLSKTDGIIEIDHTVCNDCLKCAALCPERAFAVNGAAPVRIEKPTDITAEAFNELIRRRRSIRHFLDRPVPRPLLAQAASAAGFAPTMNKAIEALVVDDRELLSYIDDTAIRFYKRAYTFMFGFRPFTAFIRLFAPSLPVIKKKMSYDLIRRGHILKTNTPALIILAGDTRVPMTEVGAQYEMANVLLFCQASGLGSCLMDSLKIAINHTKALRVKLGLPRHHRVLSVLAVGYPEETIVNRPDRSPITVCWNRELRQQS